MPISPVAISPTGKSESLQVDPADLAEVKAALQFAVKLGQQNLFIGAGHTAKLWDTLATIAAHDLGAARAIEPHLDGIAIFHEAQQPLPDGPAATWGVFAAEGGPALLAHPTGDRWALTGTKPWCSLADHLDSALVTATLPDGARALFAVKLTAGNPIVQSDGWIARGLAEIPSVPLRFEMVAATPVGAPGWYLQRPGFAWGGVSVAACWFGGIVGLARTLYATAHSSPNPDAIMLMQLGTVDETLESARRALAEAAQLIDSGRAVGAAGKVLALRVRATVAEAAEETLTRVGHVLGPAPLVQNEQHAKRVADLSLYIRQHHAEKDLAALGGALVRGERAPW